MGTGGWEEKLANPEARSGWRVWKNDLVESFRKMAREIQWRRRVVESVRGEPRVLDAEGCDEENEGA